MNIKHRFILVIWIIYFVLEIFLSNAFGLIDFLLNANVVGSYILLIDIDLIRWLAILSGFLVIFNFRPKITLLVFIGAFLYVNYGTFFIVGSYGYWVFYTFPLIILYASLHDKSKNFKLTDDFLKASYALFYFFAGFAKIYPFWQFPDWLMGYTIENLLLSRQPTSLMYTFFNFDLFTLDPVLIKVGIFFSVILELSAILLIWYRRYSLLFIPAILFFHFSLFLTGTPGIIVYSFAALIWVPENLINSIFQKLKAFSNEHTLHKLRPQGLFAAIFQRSPR